MLKKVTSILFIMLFVASANLFAQDSVDISVTYQADMELEFLKGSFDPATDTVEVRGAYFGWGSEAPDMVQNAINPNVYEHTETQRAAVGDSLPAYKFYYTPGNWEGGDNRYYQITQTDVDNGYAVVARAFNDASLDNVINQDATIKFTVNTAGAISSINNTAFSAVNTVHLTGAVQPLSWPDGGWPDAQLDRMIAMYDDGTNGDETAADGIFSAEVVFPKYTGFRIQYKYGINYGDAANNQGGNDNENGVGADHFITLSAKLESATVVNVFGTMGEHDLEDVMLAKKDSVDISVTYQADMELEFLKGSFDPATDTVEVRGAYFGWGSEAPDMVQNAVNPNVYEHTETQRAGVGDSLPAYKFYYTPGNWEGGDNRYYQITQEDFDNGYAVVSRSFNDANLETVVNQDVTILFTVNTAGAISSINNTAFSAVNTVHLTGAVQPLSWPDGGWPDAQLDRMIAMYDDGTNGDVTSGDGIFSTQVVFPKYTGFRIQYKYGINYGDAANNQGGNDNENGVGADHFINLTADLVSATVVNVFGTMGEHDLEQIISDVELVDQLPTGFELSQNYPNPFNPSTQIQFQIDKQQDVSLKIYNLLGQEILTLVNEKLEAGVYNVNFDASELSTGVYIYSITAGKNQLAKKMTLLK